MHAPGLVLLGALALSGCTPQLASGIIPAASGTPSGSGDAEQACAAQQGGTTMPAACIRERQVAQAAIVAGGDDAPQPERTQRGDTQLLSATGGVANALTQWRTAFGRMP